MHPLCLTICCIVLTAGLPGCGERTGDKNDVLITDSAEVRIITSDRPELDSGTWTVDAQPKLEIGRTEGGEVYTLHLVTDAVVLPDGRIAVASAGTNDVKLYSSSGEHLQTVGRAGDGPGEFRSPRLLVVSGDSIVVTDRNAVSYFSLGGEFLGGEPISRQVVDVLLHRRLIAFGLIPVAPQGTLGPAQDSAAILVYSPGNSEADTIAVLPGRQTFRVELGAGLAAYTAPFGTEPMAAARGGDILVGNGSTFDVAVYDDGGKLRQIIRRGEAPNSRRVSTEKIGQFEARMLAEAPPEQRPSLRQLFSAWEYPAEHPAYDRIIVDAGHNTWTRHFSVDATEPSSWSVFDRRGGWLTELTTPVGFDVLQIGQDFILGVGRDALGVEVVQQYSITK